MTLPTLPTKFFIPPLISTMVARPRLLVKLEAGRSCKLTLVSAPAGYGKSTLLVDWVHHCGIPVSWLSLDSGDNNPGRFWGYFIAALQSNSRLKPVEEGENSLEMLEAGSQRVDDEFFSSLVAYIAAISDPFLFILDDLHLVTMPEILDQLFYLLDNLPAVMSGMHLVVSCRDVWDAPGGFLPG